MVAVRATRNVAGLVAATTRTAATSTTTTAPTMARALSMSGRLRVAIDHPGHAETVGGHAEARREEGLGQGHLHLAALAERCEQPVGLGDAGRGDRQREALEVRLPLAAAVRCHHSPLPDADAGMHHLVAGSPGAHVGTRPVLAAHHHPAFAPP